MAIPVLIIGESGTGKTTSARNLDPKTTMILKVVNKPLPFKNNKEYKKENKNCYVTDNYDELIKILKGVDQQEKMKHIKTIVIDDASYLLTYQLFEKAKDVGYTKFVDIALSFNALAKTILQLKRDDLVVYLLGHQQEKDGKVKFKAPGNMVDEKLCVEGLFTIVFNTNVNNEGYWFIIQNNGTNTSKCPMGMFETNMIENNLVIVNKAISDYYGIDL